MIFETDDEELSLDIFIEDEPVDLTKDGLGADLLDLAVAGMLDAVREGRDPATGRPWAPDAARTVQQKGHAEVGVETGVMLSPTSYDPGDRTITRDRATWRYAGPDYARFFHQGREGGPFRRVLQPPRPLIGWTAGAQSECRQLVEAAAFQGQGRGQP